MGASGGGYPPTKFGNTYNVDKALMPPQICDKITCEFVDSGIDLEKSYSKETIERLDKIIPFQNLEFQEGEGYFCFDYSTLNPETGEVSVVEYHADEMMAVIVDPVEMCQGRGEKCGYCEALSFYRAEEKQRGQ